MFPTGYKVLGNLITYTIISVCLFLFCCVLTSLLLQIPPSLHEDMPVTVLATLSVWESKLDL